MTNLFFVKTQENSTVEKRVFSDGSWVDFENGIRTNRTGRSDSLRKWYREQKVAAQKLEK